MSSGIISGCVTIVVKCRVIGCFGDTGSGVRTICWLYLASFTSTMETCEIYQSGDQPLLPIKQCLDWFTLCCFPKPVPW
jgi:hypothetical protein